MSIWEVLTAQLSEDLSPMGDLSIPSLDEFITPSFPNPSPTQALQPLGKPEGSAAAWACHTSLWLFSICIVVSSD